MKTPCYTAAQLRDYTLGQLPEEQCERISSHVETCPTCEETLVSLDKEADTCIQRLRFPIDFEPMEVNSALQQAIGFAKRNVVADQIDAVVENNAEPDDREDSQSSPPDFLESTQLGHYRLFEPIGRGGMGVIYRAHHDRLHRDVAIKILPNRKLAHATAVGRFRREMQAVGQLHHPAIVHATDAGEIDGVQYLAMEYIDGLDLATIVRRCGPLDVPAACHIVCQAARGLAHAHEQGIIHRDVKPSNLMITVDGHVKILDLGLALLGAAQSAVDELTTVGQLMGTLDYMAPEQCENCHDVDQRADIYSLGATAYKLLTGKAPYETGQWKGPLQKLRAIATSPAAPIGSVAPHLPESLAITIDRCLAHERDQRMNTMNDVAESLESFSAEAHAATLAELVVRARALSDLSEPVGVSADDLLSNRSLRENPRLEPMESFVLPAGPTRSSRIGRLLRNFLALAGCIALAAIIVLKTNQGEIVIETARPDVEVKIKRSGKEYKNLELTQGEKRLRVAAGEYEIELVADHDSLEIKDGVFTLKRGDIWIAKVVEKAAGSSPVQADDRAGPRSTAFDLDPNNIKIGQWLTLKRSSGEALEVYVFADGSIRLEGIGSVKVAGRSLDAVSKEILDNFRTDFFLTFSARNMQEAINPTTDPRRAVAQVPDPRRLEIGQQLSIVLRGLFNDDEKCTIFADGSIIVPYVGAVSAADRSLDEVRKEIIDRLEVTRIAIASDLDRFVLSFSSEQPTWPTEANSSSSAIPSPDRAPPSSRPGLTYQGKNFEEWSSVLLSERDPASVKAAMDAVSRLAKGTHEKEAAELILKAAANHQWDEVGSDVGVCLQRLSLSTVATTILANLKSDVELNRVRAAECVRSLSYKTAEFRDIYEQLLLNRKSTNPEIAKAALDAMFHIAEYVEPTDWLEAKTVELLKSDDLDVALVSCVLLSKIEKHADEVVERLLTILVQGSAAQQTYAGSVAIQKLPPEGVSRLLPELLRILREGKGDDQLWSKLPRWLNANGPHTKEIADQLDDLQRRFPARANNIANAARMIRQRVNQQPGFGRRGRDFTHEGKSGKEWSEVLLNERDPEKVKAALSVFAQFPGVIENDVELAMKAAAHQNWNDVSESIIVILSRSGPNLVPPILKLLKSDTESDRRGALKCIALLANREQDVGRPEFRELIDTLLQIRSSANGELAQESLHAMYSLVRYLRLSDWLESKAAGLLDSDDFDVALVACSLLSKSVIYQEKAIERLRKSLLAEDPSQRASAVYVVTTLSGETIARLLPELIQILRDTPYRLKSTVRVSLINGDVELWSLLLKKIAKDGPHSAGAIASLEKLQNDFPDGSIERSMIASTISSIRKSINEVIRPATEPNPNPPASEPQNPHPPE